MKKKKLSLRQQSTMQRSRQSRASQFDRVLEGRVVVHRSWHLVCQSKEGQYVVYFNKAFSPNVGDWVRYGLDNNSHGQLLEICPRQNILYRDNAHSQRKELAANIDLAFIMLACKPTFYPEVLSQYLTILSIQKVPCCFLLNKIDLCQDGHYPHIERFKYFAQHDLADYILISCQTGLNLDKALKKIQDKVAIVIGPSGSGKSSFVKKLTDNSKIKIGDLSETGVGSHTTSVTEFYSLNENTHLIDSPGIRQMSLVSMTVQELQAGFPDFSAYNCRFRNCDHRQTAGCAVKEHLQEHFRYHDYCALWEKFVELKR